MGGCVSFGHSVTYYQGLLTLKLDFILNDQILTLRVNGLGEFGRNGVVSSRVLHNKTFVAFHAFVDSGLLYSPLTNICPFLIVGGLLLGV